MALRKEQTAVRRPIAALPAETTARSVGAARPPATTERHAMRFPLGPLAFALMALPAHGFDIQSMTDAERAAFGDAVRAYLLAHPEILVDVGQALQAKQDAEQAKGDAAMIAANAAEIFADANSYVGGNPEGDITLVEFLDYRCAYCRKAHGDVAELVSSDGNIRYLVKEFPILGDQSVVASRFAIAADRKSTRLNSSHIQKSRMPSSA